MKFVLYITAVLVLYSVYAGAHKNKESTKNTRGEVDKNVHGMRYKRSQGEGFSSLSKRSSENKLSSKSESVWRSASARKSGHRKKHWM